MAANGMHKGYGRNMKGMQEGCTRHTEEVHEGTQGMCKGQMMVQRVHGMHN